MVNVKEIAEKVYEVRAEVAGMDDVFSAYIVDKENAVLMEPGPASITPYIQEGMEYLGIKGLSYIIPTHIHIDHAGGMGKLARLYPEARVVLHPQGAKHAVDPSRLIESTRTVWGDDCETFFGPVEPVPEARIKVVEDREIIPVNGRELEVIYAPGHAPHHIAIFDRSIGALFCGEALGLPVHNAKDLLLPTAAPPGFDMEVYLDTMELLRGFKPGILIYSHHGVGTEVDKLISIAEENTRVYGDIILRSLKQGEARQTIAGRIEEYVSSRFGVKKAQNTDYEMNVDAYTLYFKKKGLV
ncbi:MBL fold metallo-hydrolase [Chloroflexota bacterium]